MKTTIFLVLFASLLVVGFAASPRNIFFGNGNLVATLILPYGLQLLPLTVNNPLQQWSFDGGYIISIYNASIVFDVSSTVGGTRLFAATKKLTSPSNTNQLWNVYPNGTIESRLSAGFFIGPDTDTVINFLEVDYNAALPARITTPVYPYICTSYGDPHITRFAPCVPQLEAQEGGSFALANFGNVRVSSSHGPCGGPGVFCNNKTNVIFGGNRVEVVGDTVRINGAPVVVTGTLTIVAGFTITRQGAGNYLISFPTGSVTVTSLGGTFQNIRILVTSGPVPDGGLCHCRDGPNLTPFARKRALPAREFVHSWKYLTICEDPFFYASVAEYNVANPPTTPSSEGNLTTTNENLRNNAILLCAPLLNGSLVTQCSPFLDPAPFYQDCLDDVIGTEDPKFAAYTIDAYADKCAELGPVKLPASGAYSIAYGPGIAPTVPQSIPTSFIIRAKDARHNNRTTGGDVFVVTSTGPANLTFTVVDKTDGTYKVSYTPTVVGNYIIHVLYRGVDPISNSPFSVTVVSNVANATLSTASGLGIENPIFAGDTYTITVQAKLASGANKSTGGDTLTVDITGTAFKTIKDNGDGTYTITYEQVQITPFTITIRINGGHINGSPFALESW